MRGSEKIRSERSVYEKVLVSNEAVCSDDSVGMPCTSAGGGQRSGGGDRLCFGCGSGGAGIGQDGAGIEYGLTILSYAKIDIVNGTVNGGTGGRP